MALRYRIIVGFLFFICLVPIRAFAGFDWGGDGDCSGSGSFEQAIAQDTVVTIGEIPIGKDGVAINLRAENDIDIQLFDGDKKIVHWPDGLLNGGWFDSIPYEGMTIEYSGYNGDGTGLGNEYIRISGLTTRTFTMKAYGYAAGTATVNYSWSGTVDCVNAPAESGSGYFRQYIQEDAVVEVGTLVAGLNDVKVALTSDEDVDIQLLDVSTTTQIVHWPHGLLNGPKPASITYEGVTIEYSGYDGVDNNLGHEYIKITGTLDRDYQLSAYGYRAGEALIEYSWGEPGGDDDRSCTVSADYFPYSVASGDPTESSIVLWTRLQDPALSSDTSLRFELAESNDFATLLTTGNVAAKAIYGYNAKKKVTGLPAGETLYYRFRYDRDGVDYCSPTGRTRTAPPANADVPVRFTVVSGQDYIGKYWNTYRHMITQGFEADTDGIDFIVHLGDYIYETTGDPAFQSTEAERSIAFSDPAGAIRIGTGDGAFYAAQSRSNYDDIYEHYRSDKVLQALHQYYPWYVVWDDHEYSDDYWNDTAQYFDYRSESNPQRKYDAERAYFEWMPLDVGLGANGELSLPAYSGKKLTADGDYALHHPIRWGRNFAAYLTDTRNVRPDHAIDETGWPGTVVMTKSDIEMALQTTTGAMRGKTYNEVKDKFFGSYINIDASRYSQQVVTTDPECAHYNYTVKDLLIEQLTQDYAAYFRDLEGAEAMSASAANSLARERAEAAIAGNISAYSAYRLLWNWIQDHSALGDSSGALASLSESYWSDPPSNAWWVPGDDCLGGGWGFPLQLYPKAAAYDNLPKGLSLLHLGKINLFSSHGVGARYVIVKQNYDLYSHFRYLTSNKGSESILGTTQEDELLATLRHSDARWRLVFSQVSSIPMVIAPQKARELDSAIDLALSATEASLRAGSALGSWNAKQGLHILDYEFYMNLDGWDGFTNKRADLLRQYDQFNQARNDQNTVLISGDIHSSWVARQSHAQGLATNIYEFTGTSVSSGTGKGLVVNKIDGSFLEQLGIEDILIDMGLDKVNSLVKAGYDGMDYVNIADNGYMYFTIDGAELTNTYFLFDVHTVSQNYYGADYGGSAARSIDDLEVATKVYRIRNGVLSSN